MSVVNCTQWERQKWSHSGLCLLDFFGGYPSIGTCQHCRDRIPIQPDGPAAVVEADPSTPNAQPSGPSSWGPEFWDAAHARPLRFSGDEEAEIAWIDRWGNSLPGGCLCKSEWARELSVEKPDLSNPKRYALWWWRRHNGVNRNRAVPKFPWPNAVARHGYPAEWLAEDGA